MHLLLLAFLVPFIAGLLVPQRWYLWLSVCVVYGAACWILVRGVPDVDPVTAAYLGVVGFCVAVAAVALAAVFRFAMRRANARRNPGAAPTPDGAQS